MKRFATNWMILATVVFVICISTAGCTSNTGNQTPSGAGSQAPPASQMITYDSRNFTILYPSDWKNSTTYAGLMEVANFYPELKSGEYVRLSAAFQNLNTSLSEWTAAHDATIEGLQKYVNVTYIERGDATLTGNPAYKIVYTKQNGSVDRKVTEIWTVNKGKPYTIMYEADRNLYDAYADTFQKMTDSFQIK